jgi:hypothetical protein
MRTDKPLLVSFAEASFQLSLQDKEIVELVRDGELIAVNVRGRILIAYDSLIAFARRVKRNCAVREVPASAAA